MITVEGILALGRSGSGIRRITATVIFRILRDIGILAERFPFTIKAVNLANSKQIVEVAELCQTSIARNSFVRMLETAVRLHHRGTAQHQLRVRTLCLLTYDNLLFSAARDPQEREQLDIAARLHDFGKICMRTNLIDKPGIFDDTEKAIKEHHVDHAVWIFERISWLRPIAGIIRYNHYFDGYPAGLSRDKMSKLSQILSMADMFDALTDPTRTYRRAITREAALDILQDRNYDYDILQAFAKAVYCLGN